MKALIVENLKIGISFGDKKKIIVENGDFSVENAEIVGFLGESGSGKTTIAHALCGLLNILPYRTYSRLVPEVESGIIRFVEGCAIDIARNPDKLRSLLGRGIFLMPQSPSACLNPYRTVGEQIREVAGNQNVGLYLEEVGLSRVYAGFYPHQLSGGMKRRVLIAMARALGPRVLIADEPTEGLDAETKEEMLRLFVKLVKESETAILIITHDLESLEMLQELGGVSPLKTLLLFSKKIIRGTLPEVVNLLNRSGQSFETNLLLPDIPPCRKDGGGLLQVHHLTKSYPSVGRVLDSVSFEISPGERVGLIGPSGSGKTTLIRCVGGVEKPDAGKITWKGSSLIPFPYKFRRDIQIIWQDPYTTLPPHRPVRKIIEEPIKSDAHSGKRCETTVHQICNFLGIKAKLLDQYPWQLSGGEAQRVAIARSIVTYPRCVLADEPLNGLHLPEKRRLLLLLGELFNFWGVSLLVVSHHMETVHALTERVMILREGRIGHDPVSLPCPPAALSFGKPYPERVQ